MKNKLIYILFLFLFTILLKTASAAEELNINATNIELENENKKVLLRGEVSAFDKKNNRIFTDSADYYKEKGLLETFGNTKIITSGGYTVIGSNIIFDNTNKTIVSNFDTQIIDIDNNNIFLDMFSYSIDKGMFFSKGKIKIIDNKDNKYNFSEVYIDENKNQIVGSDVRVFLDEEKYKIDSRNDPRFYSNTMVLKDNQNDFDKGVFTYCKIREGEKCPPWSIKSKKIKHDKVKKTIYYDKAVLRVYDFPIFYFPKFFHPDPTVKRRSGFLTPSFTDSSNIGSGLEIPYFWSIAKNQDFTITPKLYSSENPLLLTEYRKVWEKTKLMVNAGYTEGYKKSTATKKLGDRMHLFTRINKDLSNNENIFSEFELNIQQVNNETYLKIHDINSALINNEVSVLENSLDYSYQNDDYFFSANASAFEDLTKSGRKKYEYLLPYLSFDKNLLANEDFGLVDYNSTLRVKNYDVNKQTEFFVNDFKWRSNKWLSKFGLENQLKGLVKTVNYNSKNVDGLKDDDSTSELSGVIGFISKLPFFKNDSQNNSNSSFTPNFLLRYAPAHMRKIENKKFTFSDLYSLKKTSEIDVIETGLSATLGFDLEKNKLNADGTVGANKYSFSAGQVISEKENRDLPGSSLGQRFSDVVGSSKYRFNEKIDTSYNFAIDQNYEDFNMNEIGLNYKDLNTTFNVSYLEEKEDLGNQEYIKTSVGLGLNEFNKISFSSKRNLLTSSAEFYNISYEYINDCLKAGIGFRREFYTDRDVEPENSLQFRISIVPFADISSPTFSR